MDVGKENRTMTFHVSVQDMFSNVIITFERVIKTTLCCFKVFFSHLNSKVHEKGKKEKRKGEKEGEKKEGEKIYDGGGIAHEYATITGTLITSSFSAM